MKSITSNLILWAVFAFPFSPAHAEPPPASNATPSAQPVPGAQGELTSPTDPPPPKTDSPNSANSGDSSDSDDQEEPTSQDSELATSTPRALRIYDDAQVRERADDLLGIADSATEGSTGRLDLAKRPVLRPGELLETTPGVVATQHSGGGKANQFFVRGFNLDHGTDFSIHVDGIPVNMPTHGHGQGYSDLSFLIPEMVERVRYRKGPYYADVGDFSAAGSVSMSLVDDVPGHELRLTGGSYDYGRALWSHGRDLGSGRLVTAVEGFHEDGPWTRGQSYEGFKGLARFNTGDDRRGYSVTLMGYSADWLSTDQIPRRAVDSGLIGRFDLLDPGPRGDTDRFSLSADWRSGDESSLLRANAYLLYYDFGLISNFTYFLENAADGDQFEQTDRRWVGGFQAQQSWVSTFNGRPVELHAGIDGRYDDIDNGLFRTRNPSGGTAINRDPIRLSTVRQDAVYQLRSGTWADATVRWSDKVRTRLGLRWDVFYADVTSDLAANSGSITDDLLSPKLSLILGPWNSTEVYLNLGYGYHSNDARGAVIAVDPTSGETATPVEPLVRAKGVDLGVRTTSRSGLLSTVTVFALELDSELVFVGDGGATEASRPSRRIGVEWTNFYRLHRNFALDFDVTLTDAEFTDDAPEGDDIPGAIGTTIASGIAFDSTDSPLFAALRWRYFGDVPLIEDGTVEWSSSSLVNARVGYRLPNNLELTLEVFNLLDADDSDIEYFYASRLPGEAPGGVEDIHFHPMERRSARLVLTWRR